MDTNYTLNYRKDHPKNRCSYGVPGVSGIVVFDKNLFAGGVPPATITVDVELALPKVVSATAKAEAAAVKAAEKAAKAAEKIAKATAKAAERQAKADAALATAKAKADAAAAAAAKA